jgi:hypothetical protein
VKEPNNQNKVTFITYMGGVLHILVPKGQSSGNTQIEMTKKSYWVISGFYVNEISSVQLVGLY